MSMEMWTAREQSCTGMAFSKDDTGSLEAMILVDEDDWQT